MLSVPYINTAYNARTTANGELKHMERSGRDLF